MKIFLICVALLVLPFAVCALVLKIYTETYSYRFRLTVEIDTPEGVKSGSSVIQVITQKMPKIHSLWVESSTSIQGEAVYVDLGEGKNVVALLARGDRANTSSLHTIPPRAILKAPANTSYAWEWTAELAEMQGRKADLEGSLIPTIITFSDMRKPETAEIIYAANAVYQRGNVNSPPSEVTVDRLVEKFGEGYRFKRAWIEITDDPVTYKIEKIMPWLINFPSGPGATIYMKYSDVPPEPGTMRPTLIPAKIIQ